AALAPALTARTKSIPPFQLSIAPLRFRRISVAGFSGLRIDEARRPKASAHQKSERRAKSWLLWIFTPRQSWSGNCKAIWSPEREVEELHKQHCRFGGVGFAEALEWRRSSITVSTSSPRSVFSARSSS